MSTTHRDTIAGAWSAIAASRGETVVLSGGGRTAELTAVRSSPEQMLDEAADPLVDDVERMDFSFVVSEIQAAESALWPIVRGYRITDTDGNVWEVNERAGETPFRFKDSGKQIAEVHAELYEAAT